MTTSLISGNLVIEGILSGEHKAFGYRLAYFSDLPKVEPFTEGWIDLSEGDHNPRIEDDILYLDLWYGSSFPDHAVIDRKQVEGYHGPTTMSKVRIAIAVVDVEYANIDGKRCWTDWSNWLFYEPGTELQRRAIEEWETAWSTYMSKLKRLDELKAAGRYGYQLRMPNYAIQLAVKRLKELDPDFCARILMC
jgi:hypothetical protein